MVRARFRCTVLLAIVVVVGLVVFAALTYPRFRADVQPNRERLLSESDVLTTEGFGDIEYAVQGEGSPVLLAHGAGGGYDQGLLIGENYVGEGHRLIAPSRFGYLRSSIPEEDGSPGAQADAYAALLDALGVERVGVVAFSDGGPSGLQFALRHPERCEALVMISAKSQSAPPDSLLQGLVFESIFRSDYLFWLITEVRAAVSARYVRRFQRGSGANRGTPKAARLRGGGEYEPHKPAPRRYLPRQGHPDSAAPRRVQP